MVLSMDRWVGKVAVVTGASGGIGKAIAEELVTQGLQVAALARRKDLLDELSQKLAGQKGKLHPIKTDLSKEEDILNAFKYIKDNLGPVHILVNNAGFRQHGTRLSEGDSELWKKIFQVNVIALSIATREAIKDMKANKVDGHIIHINSVLGHQVLNVPVPINVYPASKFAVRALAETLRLELNSLKSKIKITNLSPGLVKTDFVQNHAKESPAYNKLIETTLMLNSEDVADAVVYVLSTPPHVQIQELILRPINEGF